MIGKKSAKWIVGAGSALAVALLFQHAKADQALTEAGKSPNVRTDAGDENAGQRGWPLFGQPAPEPTVSPEIGNRFGRGFRYEDGVTPHARTRRS